MNVEITPATLGGAIRAVSSKSHAHRILIAAALSDKKTAVKLNALSDDINATMNCLTALGARFELCDGGIAVYPISKVGKASLDCCESGSTLRFLMPVAAALCDDTEFRAQGKLPQRPINELRREMEKNGCVFSPDGEFPVKIKRRLKSGEFTLPGNVSSQYVTGLLFALPIVDGDSVINLTSPLQSKSYVDMTLETLKLFGINIDCKENAFYIKGSQKYVSPGTISVEGDWSNGAFWLCAGALNDPVTVTNLNVNSAQGDRKILEILSQMGALVVLSGDSIRVSARNGLEAVEIDARQIPDLAPVLAATSVFAKGKTVVYNAARLRIKECDRLSAITSVIKSLGGKINQGEDFIEIFGGTIPEGGSVSGFNDHRIVMSAAIAASQCKNKVVINGAQAVNKSYPAFFEDYKRLGGKLNVVNNWK